MFHKIQCVWVCVSLYKGDYNVNKLLLSCTKTGVIDGNVFADIATLPDLMIVSC